MYILEGQLESIYGDQILILDPGDNVYFDSNVPHAGKSLGKKKARLLVVIYFYKCNQVGLQKATQNTIYFSTYQMFSLADPI
jgi:quercetin dioxygenase-like cupin family protein